MVCGDGLEGRAAIISPTVAITQRRVFLQRPGHHAAIWLGQHRDVGLGGEVLHQHLADALALEGDPAGEHLVEHDAQGVDVDFLAVAAVGHFGGHVVDGADALGMPAAAAARDELRQPVVAHLHHALVAEDVARLQVAMNDAAVVQIGHAGADAANPGQTSAGGRPWGWAARTSSRLWPAMYSITTQVSPWSSWRMS